MTEFITRNYGNKNFEIIIKTDSKEHYNATQDFARGLIDHAKPAHTIEAKPIVHAHWDDNKCSNCKEEASSHSWEEPIYDYDWDENLQFLYTEHHTEYELTDFCPHCGAQMDEVVE